MTAPLQPQTLPRLLADMHRRLRGLEAFPQSVRLQIKLFRPDEAVRTGDDIEVILISEDMDVSHLIRVETFVTTVSSSGPVTVQIRNVITGVDMLSTPVTIDAGQYTSYAAATQAVIDRALSRVSTGTLVAIDVDTAGSGARGLGVVVTFGNP